MLRHQVVCFCDIPVSDLGIHMGKYSRFGLSFLKPFLIEKGANPVLYVSNNSSSLSIGPLNSDQIAGRRELFEANVRQYLEVMDLLMESDESPLSLAARTSASDPLPPGMSKQQFDWQRSLWPKIHSLDRFLALYVFSHLKYFDASTADDDPSNVYMEREWRVLGNINFALSNVRRVFLPEEFAERFRGDLPEYSGQLTFSGHGG